MTSTWRAAAPRDRQSGQASVELALLLPVVLVLLLAVLQVGLVARDTVLVSHAAREAARAAAVDGDPSAATRAVQASSGLRDDRVTVTVTGRGDAGSRATATVTYRAPTDVPIVGALLGDRTISASVTMRVEGP